MQVNSVAYYVTICRGRFRGTVVKIVRSGRLRWTELVLKEWERQGERAELWRRKLRSNSFERLMIWWFPI